MDHDNPENPVYQYLIVRTDADSMTPGRVAAQCAHAANQCVAKAAIHKPKLLKEWVSETNEGFGTTIVLKDDNPGPFTDFWENLLITLKEDKVDCVAGILHDPTYRLDDGAVIHTVPFDTVLWILGRRDDLFDYLNSKELFLAVSADKEFADET